MLKKVLEQFLRNKYTVLLILVFLLSLFLRVYKLSDYPDAIDEDEMSMGYISYSLLKNGTDEYGHKFPIYFESVGDYKYGLYSYFSMIPISIMGLNTFSTRFMAAIFGSLSVVAIYFLTKEITSKKSIGLLAALVLSLNPTHIHFSRVAYSNIMGAFFVTLMTFYYIKWIKKNDKKTLLWTIILFLLSIFSYQAYRIIAILIILLVPFFYNKYSIKNIKKIFALVFLMTTLVVLSFIPNESRVRSSGSNILVDKPALVENYAEDNISGTDLITTRLFHNKYQIVLTDSLKRYLSYFDPRFLFLELSENSSRHSIPNLGVFYLIEALIVLFAFKKNYSLATVLFLIAPIPASMVVGERSIVRSVFIVYPMAILLGVGVWNLINTKYKKIAIFMLVPIYLMSFSFFAHQYLVHKYIHHPWYTDVGLKEASLAIKDKYYNNYEKIVVSSGHYIPFLFYWKVDPTTLHKNAEILSSMPEVGTKFSRYDKIYFNMQGNCIENGSKNVLYFCLGHEVPKGSTVVETFYFRDGQPAVNLIEFK